MPHAHTCSACVAAKVQRPAVSYSDDDLIDAPKDPWTRWWDEHQQSQWVCTDCFCTRDPEELEALIGKPIEVWPAASRWVISPLVAPDDVALSGSYHAHYTDWRPFRSALHGAQQAVRRNEGLETLDEGPAEPFNPKFPENGLARSRTCEACIRAGARPPAGRAAGEKTLLSSGWATWSSDGNYWVCPSCFASRDFAELEDLLGTPSHVETSRDRLYGPVHGKFWEDKTLPGHYRTADEFETAIAIEQAATQVDVGRDDTQADTRDADAPTARPRALSLPADVTPEMVARDVLGLEILGQAGRGALGTVLKVRDGDLILAFKYIHGGADRPQGFERLRREVAVMLRLNHPNIVKIVRSFGDRGIPAYLMEYVDGLSLARVLQDGALSFDRATAIAEQVCEALNHAHGQGIIHRDIKPHNVLLTREGQAKLSDFGIAKLAQDMPEAFTLTQTGDQVGTPAYMSPEQRARPHEVDHRADIYSVGVMLWAMVSGQRPRLERGQVELVLGPTVPRIDAIVARATATDPAARYGNIKALAQDLLAARLSL